jgi:hypothetical protein
MGNLTPGRAFVIAGKHDIPRIKRHQSVLVSATSLIM